MASKAEGKPPAKPARPREDRARDAGRYAYDGLERVLHERARLSILSSLASHTEGIIFNDLKALCSLTDGNLSRQLQVLQEAGLVEILKGFKNNRPQTRVQLTPDGRRRFLDYIAVLEGVVADASSATSKSHRPGRAIDGLSPA
ncbi:MAG: putative transcriptional regulator [Phycisphaerales bacterium]|nr:putative transcriptional regulator [Phycisphaerales bacterium]MDB5305531.1 putative transcriptional regulator [Phycisphaerales bacterium]